MITGVGFNKLKCNCPRNRVLSQKKMCKDHSLHNCDEQTRARLLLPKETRLLCYMKAQTH